MNRLNKLYEYFNNKYQKVLGNMKEGHYFKVIQQATNIERELISGERKSDERVGPDSINKLKSSKGTDKWKKKMMRKKRKRDR